MSDTKFYDQSLVVFPSGKSIIKATIPDDLRLEILNGAKGKVDDSINCSLKNTSRTNYYLHTQEEFIPTTAKIERFLFDSAMQYLRSHAPARLSGMNNIYKGAWLRIFNLWVAWYTAKSRIEPHLHGGMGMFGGLMSFACYLEVPPEGTSLTFMDGLEANIPVKVRQNDILVFNSEMYHFSNDTCDGRTVMSGNFTFRVDL